LINIEKEVLPNGSAKFTMTENKVIDTNKYIEFVRQTTSPASSDLAQLLARITELEASDDADIPRLLTASLGMSAEAGEFTEVVKKIILQGKPYNKDNVFHLKRELGDICWYMAQACMALDTTFEEVLQMNYEKLSARYPDGTFDVYRSENRVEGDL
jgi:NTP pyrophosphatase (non-canonical NTP hydrolase)